MKQKLVDSIRRTCRSYPIENMLQGMLGFIHKLNPALGEAEVSAYGVTFDQLRSDRLPDLLDELPTETTRAERRFLHFFFSRLWSGRDHVLEVGPFLGGTTRAMALGMLENPHRSPESRLATYDRFRHYYSPDALSNTLKPLVDRRVLTAEDVATLGESASFLEIFRRLHGKHEYFKLIEVMCESLPATLQEAAKPGSWMKLNTERNYSAVFVDGCKSWYATKYFLQQLACVTNEGSAFLFQDYEHYTCFWIPAAVYLLADYFEPQMHVDTTYVYTLKKPLIMDVIDERMPDEPSQVGAGRFREMFTELTRQAQQRRDGNCEVAHALHLAAALAYLGDLDAARNTIQDIAKIPAATHYRRQIRQARISPTYLPDGQQIRL